MHTYEVDLEWNSDRKGTIGSPVLSETIEVATPPEFAKGMPGIWSPEHLFVAAVNSCMMTTFLAIAENSKLNFEHFSCNAVGTLEKVDGKFQITEITLRPKLVISEPRLEDKALRVLEMSEKACLISNSILSKVTLEPKVLIAVQF
jgi:peroxiredoxin-like protein